MSLSNLPFGLVFHIGANPARKILLHATTHAKLQKTLSFGRQVCDMKLRKQI